MMERYLLTENRQMFPQQVVASFGIIQRKITDNIITLKQF